MEEITTRVLDIGESTPLAAYAALRAKASGRSSFLLEMTEPDERGEQRSVIGFLVKRESAHPTPADALEAVATTAARMPGAEVEGAAAGVEDVFALLMFDAVLPVHGVAPWPDQAFAGREVSDLAAIVFDHVAGSLTIAAKNPNVVERIARVIAGAPPLAELPPAGGPLPEYMIEQPPETVFTKQYARAQRRLALGGIDHLLVNRTFTAPARGADLLDVHRALGEAAPARYRFFIDFSTSPMFAGYAVSGTARRSVTLSAAAGAEALAGELLALFSVDDGCGVPAKEALAAWRDIGAGPLGMRGGAVLRMRPGGGVEALIAEAHVAFEKEQFHTVGVAAARSDRDTAGHLAAAQEDARAALSAIRRAHDAAAAREAASAQADEAAS